MNKEVQAPKLEDIPSSELISCLIRKHCRGILIALACTAFGVWLISSGRKEAQVERMQNELNCQRAIEMQESMRKTSETFDQILEAIRPADYTPSPSFGKGE